METTKTRIDPKSRKMIEDFHNKYGWPKDQYIIWGSAIFAFLGLRPMNDIDVLCTASLFERIKKSYEQDYTWYEKGHARIHLDREGPVIEVEEFNRFLDKSVPGAFPNPTSVWNNCYLINGFKVPQLIDIVIYKVSRKNWLVNSTPELKNFHQTIIDHDIKDLEMVRKAKLIDFDL